MCYCCWFLWDYKKWNQVLVDEDQWGEGGYIREVGGKEGLCGLATESTYPIPYPEFAGVAHRRGTSNFLFLPFLLYFSKVNILDFRCRERSISLIILHCKNM